MEEGSGQIRAMIAVTAKATAGGDRFFETLPCRIFLSALPLPFLWIGIGVGPKSAGLNIMESCPYPTSAAGESFLVSSVILLFTQRVKSKMTDRCPEDKSSGGVWGEAPGPCLRIWG